jgi:AmmeMemoRadiSam system protein B
MANAQLRVRQPRYADDMWYSSIPPQLESDILEYLNKAPAQPEAGRPIGLVTPHAGYLFSGHVAGAAFAGLAPGAYDTVVLIGPDHRGAAPGQISTANVDIWRTPLGDIPVDWDILHAIQDEVNLRLLPGDDEHALEIELPFLQMTLKQFSLVPLMMGDQSPGTCRRLGLALAQAVTGREQAEPERRALLVASSDLSHYFDDETARRLDQDTLQFVLKLDADGLVHHVETARQRREPLACGAGPIAVVLHAAQSLGASQARLIKYATSADVHPRSDRVVGYAAVAIS